MSRVIATTRTKSEVSLKKQDPRVIGSYHICLSTPIRSTYSCRLIRLQMDKQWMPDGYVQARPRSWNRGWGVINCDLNRHIYFRLHVQRAYSDHTAVYARFLRSHPFGQRSRSAALTKRIAQRRMGRLINWNQEVWATWGKINDQLALAKGGAVNLI